MHGGGQRSKGRAAVPGNREPRPGKEQEKGLRLGHQRASPSTVSAKGLGEALGVQQVPSSACRGISQQVWKGVIMAAVPLAMPLNKEALILWCLGHFPQTFPVLEPGTPFPTGCLFKDNSCPLPGSAFQTPLSSMHDSQLTLGCAELQHRPCTQFLLCPTFYIHR